VKRHFFVQTTTRVTPMHNPRLQSNTYSVRYSSSLGHAASIKNKQAIGATSIVQQQSCLKAQQSLISPRAVLQSQIAYQLMNTKPRYTSMTQPIVKQAKLKDFIKNSPPAKKHGTSIPGSLHNPNSSRRVEILQGLPHYKSN
jgi:hypothetical protein